MSNYVGTITSTADFIAIHGLLSFTPLFLLLRLLSFLLLQGTYADYNDGGRFTTRNSQQFFKLPLISDNLSFLACDSNDNFR